jgi:Protein of unknown function (DUF664)
MTTNDYPWEPPVAGTETEQLLGALDRLRTTFRWKADGLDETGLRATITSSTLTIGGLLKHLAFVEDYYSATKRAGESPGPPWESVDWDAEPDWPWATAASDSAEALYAIYDDAVARARGRYDEAIADGGLDRLVEVSDGEGRHASLRRMLFDLVEEYGRHAGHADLLREAVDGVTGEDPPARWRPTSGSGLAAKVQAVP